MRCPWFIRRELGHFFAAAAIVMLSCSGGLPNEGCDGCITSAGACVPLAQTSREQCGRGGETCQTSCPACDQGMCSTGWECFGVRPPDPCECGVRCVEGVGNLQCGTCRAGNTCRANRCVADDAGAVDADAGTRDGG